MQNKKIVRWRMNEVNASVHEFHAAATGANPMKRACVIGWPVEHSRSPAIHFYWLKQLGIDGFYEKRAVSPEDIDTFLRDLASHGYAGANVTVPHKEAALRAAVHADDAARSVGAANTLWLQDGALHASNTDIYGFLRNLDDRAPGWDASGKAAVVLGAGGAARGILRGLLDRGFGQIRLINRTVERAEELARFFGPAVEALAWDRRSAALEGAGLLVNTTTQGMGGAALDIDLRALPADAVVHDIIYVPLETPLLRQARERGLRAADGLGMLLHQAVPGFERWFGVRPEVTPELRDLIIRNIESGH
jgi:shikimate dehydrogenase